MRHVPGPHPSHRHLIQGGQLLRLSNNTVLYSIPVPYGTYLFQLTPTQSSLLWKGKDAARISVFIHMMQSHWSLETNQNKGTVNEIFECVFINGNEPTLKGTVSRKPTPMLLYIVGKLSFQGLSTAL